MIRRFYSSNTQTKRRAVRNVMLRVTLTDLLAEELQKGLAALPFTTTYDEEQRGENLVASITCTPSQEQIVRKILNHLEIAAIARDEECDKRNSA